MFTANSMNCLMEALGLALPFNGSALARTPEREALATRAAGLIMELVEKQITPRMIVTPEALDDAFALDMAMGGSTNTVLHALAIANEAGIDYPLSRINAVADKVPHTDTPNITVASDTVYKTRAEAEAAAKTLAPCKQ